MFLLLQTDTRSSFMAAKVGEGFRPSCINAQRLTSHVTTEPCLRPQGRGFISSGELGSYVNPDLFLRGACFPENLGRFMPGSGRVTYWSRNSKSSYCPNRFSSL